MFPRRRRLSAFPVSMADALALFEPLMRRNALKNQTSDRLWMEAAMRTERRLKNPEFELRGVNHLALVCSDMNRTIDFYSDVLGMPLVGDIKLPDGMGHHFFFDIGKGALLAFFWFRSAPGAAPGVTSPRKNLGDSTDSDDFISAHASMNHVAFDVPAEKI